MLKQSSIPISAYGICNKFGGGTCSHRLIVVPTCFRRMLTLGQAASINSLAPASVSRTSSGGASSRVLNVSTQVYSTYDEWREDESLRS